MYLAVDVYYNYSGAKAVGIVFLLPSEEIQNTLVEYIHEVHDYIPGAFYKRELPCILKLLERMDMQTISTIVIDGHVFVSETGEYGLGGKLWEALNGTIPIIGVAKSAFKSNTGEVKQITRGSSNKPLFISSIGIHIDEAAAIIVNMKGKSRIPDLLKLVDRLTKEP